MRGVRLDTFLVAEERKGTRHIVKSGSEKPLDTLLFRQLFRERVTLFRISLTDYCSLQPNRVESCRVGLCCTPQGNQLSREPHLRTILLTTIRRANQNNISPGTLSKSTCIVFMFDCLLFYACHHSCLCSPAPRACLPLSKRSGKSRLRSPAALRKQEALSSGSSLWPSLLWAGAPYGEACGIRPSHAARTGNTALNSRANRPQMVKPNKFTQRFETFGGTEKSFDGFGTAAAIKLVPVRERTISVHGAVRSLWERTKRRRSKRPLTHLVLIDRRALGRETLSKLALAAASAVDDAVLLLMNKLESFGDTRTHARTRRACDPCCLVHAGTRFTLRDTASLLLFLCYCWFKHFTTASTAVALTRC